jgi:hypothetical protein
MDRAIPFPGDGIGRLVFTVEQSDQFSMAVGHRRDAGFERGHPHLGGLERGFRRFGEIGEQRLAEYMPVATS